MKEELRMEKQLEQHKLEPSTICQHCKHNHVDNPDEDALCPICRSDNKLVQKYRDKKPNVRRIKNRISTQK